MTTNIEAKLSTDLNVITAEINAYKRVAGEAIFEIGRRLKDVRDAKVDADKEDERELARQREACGGWIRWLESHVDFKRRHAHRLITVVEQFGDDVSTWTHLGLRVLDEIATLPPEERERPHNIPSSGATKTVDEMTVRELREVKAELKKAEEARKKAEDDYEVIRDTLDARVSIPPEVVADPVISDRLARYEARYGDIDGEVTERISNHTEVDGAAAHFADDTQSFLMEYAHLTTFKSVFTGITDEAYDAYRTSLDALKTFVDGMERAMSEAPKGKVVVIDITDYRAI
ncbi:DUF3102 domain-containing protein [Paenibacillus humicus]|uniref:DUF3102 domain-containing protein n=1 Tax=Paenibacillus humicus TaxID=412861 RepID=UPI000FD91610|nr:DUF3102 domain-containing protein [Paenibacillus humicus]